MRTKVKVQRVILNIDPNDWRAFSDRQVHQAAKIILGPGIGTNAESSAMYENHNRKIVRSMFGGRYVQIQAFLIGLSNLRTRKGLLDERELNFDAIGRRW